MKTLRLSLRCVMVPGARAAVVSSLLAVLATGAPAAVPVPVHPAGSDLEGLPLSGEPIAAYAADRGHPLNRLHALLFMAERTPTEIGASLPVERRQEAKPDQEFFQPRWALAVRKKIDAAGDTHLFGGDVRTSPVEKWSATQAAEARAILVQLATPEKAAALVPASLARLSLQWDLLQVWWRFERTNGTDAATLTDLARAIQALGQPRAVLAGLPTGLEKLTGADSSDRRAPRVPAGLLDGAKSPWVEVDRNSAALFQAPRSLASVRAFIRGADRAAVEAMVAEVPVRAAQNQLVEVPRGTEVALLLSMVGLTAELEPVATPVASELRLRLAVGPDVLDPASDTSTRDGWNQWAWLFSRVAMTAGAPAPLRFVPDTSQALFLEYGTPKYTTYFAQCSLCHRTTYAGNQNPSGVHVLGRYAKPSVLTDPAKRGRDAEKEMAPVVAKLRARLGLATQ